MKLKPGEGQKQTNPGQMRHPANEKAGTKKARSDGGGTRKGEPSLRQKISEVLGTDPMRPVEIATALVDRGLHHGSKSLQIQVSTTLAKFEEFSRVARGQWVNGSRKNKS